MTTNGYGTQAEQRYPLDGIRIADMTVVWAGPYGAMFLADMGAEVIKVETINRFPASSRGQVARPARETEKNRPPGSSWYPDRDPGDRPWNRAASFNAHARNKYSMTVNLHSPIGKQVFRRLIEKSDVFIENNAPGTMERLGFTFPVLQEWNPRIIVVSATGLGQTGPWSRYRGYGSQFEAFYGHASVIGYPDMDPSGVPSAIATDASTGVTLAMLVVMALHQRAKTGKGSYVDVSMGENFIPHLGEYFMDYFMNGRVARSLGNRQPPFVQGCYRALGDDEWITLTIESDEQWQRLCKLIGQPDLATDPSFATRDARWEHHDEFDAVVGAWAATQGPLAAFEQLQAYGVPGGPVMYEDEVYADPQALAREFFVPIAHPEIGTHDYPSTVFKASKMPFVVRKPPIRLGEDNDYVFRQVLGYSEEEYQAVKDAGQIGMDYDAHIR